MFDGQVRVPGPGGSGAGAPAATPGLVNTVSGNNTLTGTLTTKNWNVGCANGTYCAHLADASLSGNLIAVRVLYKDSPSTTISVTDDKGGGSSIYTAGPTAHDTTNGYWMAIFYTANAASGIKNIFVNSTAAVGHVAVSVSQWYNVATSSPTDGTNGNAGANGSTTITAGNISPAVSGDLLLMWSCRTQTPAATSFTAGTGQTGVTWALLDADTDIVDGCSSQWGVYSSTSTINPQMTTSGGSGYVAAAMAIKAASAGTAPSGMYVQAIGHWQVATGVGTTTSHQLPCSANANLIVLMAGGGGDRSITGVSSSSPSLTWAATGSKNSDGNNSTRSWYASNVSTCAGTMTVTLTWDNSTGDNSVLAYVISGAAASPFRQRIARQGSMTGGTYTMFQNNNGLDGNWGPQPGITSGLALGMDIHNLNTGYAMTNPSGAMFDAISYGGQSLDGPSDGDQNNDWGHYYVPNSSLLTWTWSFAQNNEDAGAYAGELDFFAASTGSFTPTYIQSCVNDTNTTSTTITLACTPTGAGHTWVIMTSIANTAVSAISLSDTAGNTFVADDGPTTITSYSKVKTWHVTTVTNSATTMTATFTGQSGTHRHQIILMEFDGTNQTTPVDQHVLTNASEDGSGNFSSASVTTTVAQEMLAGLMNCNSVCSNAASAGSGYTEATEDSQGKAYAQWKIVTSTGSYTSSAKDLGVGGNSGAGLITLKGP